MYYLTFSRPGAAFPFALVYQRGAGYYAPGEIAPLGGKLEVLPGGFSGSGELTLSGLPRAPGTRLAPRDWVRVYLTDGNPDPVYLGEVTNEPRLKDGKLSLTLAGLKDRVGRARWKSDVAEDGSAQPFRARFRPYFQGVLSRAVLPPSVTMGDIPDLNVTLRARSLSELVADSIQQGIAATQGGTWGVDALGRAGVRQPSDALTHRFTRFESDRPAGEAGEYANCIRFEYKKPSGAQAFFEYRYTLDIALLGESWLMDNLPSSVTTVITNPYAGEGELVALDMTHPDNPNLIARQTARQPAYSPDWAGKLADGLSLSAGALYGESLPLTGVGQETVTIPAGAISNTYSVTVLNPTPGLRVRAYVNGAPVSVISGSGNFGNDAGQNYLFPVLATVEVRYDAADYQAYFLARREHPRGFGLRVGAPPRDGGPPVRGTVASAAVPGARDVVPGQIVSVQGGYWQYTQRPFAPPPAVRVGFSTLRRWQAGDTVTTGPAVTGAQALDITTSPPATLTLTRGEDDPETGRRVWVLPRAASLTDLILTGDPAQIGWIGVNLSDEAGLTAYAIGRLLPLLHPVQSWVGRYPDLRRLEVSGVARFDDEDGDEDLPVTRGVYDLTAMRSSIEAGTPQALNGMQAIRQAFAGIERVQRLQFKPGGG